MTSTKPQIQGVDPPQAVPGGVLRIFGEGFAPEKAHDHRVYFGDKRAQLTRVSRGHLSAVVPDDALPEVQVTVDGVASSPYRVPVATTLATELQPVANPVFDPEGALYVTVSGSRGEKVPVSVFRIDTDGDVEPFASDILNATGLAWGPDDCLYVSSRHEGTVHRVGPTRESDLVADELGIATGLAFDAEGILYVGDRRGTIFRIEPNGEPRSFCRIVPSVSAYHLAFDRGGDLFVTAPSLSSVDPVYRVAPDGEVSIFAGGFGRPQGLAFDPAGLLYVAEGLVGDSGLYRVTAEGEVSRAVAAPPLVGVAFDPNGGVALAGASTIFHLDFG